MSKPSELEAALREGGEKVTQGRIRVDSARALERLRKFRFAEPAHWVLEVLRAAALSDATNVSVRTDADDVHVTFDGRPFSEELMRHLLEQAFNDDRTPEERRTRLLALGVVGALGMGARFVRVESGGVALELSGDAVEVTQSFSQVTTLHLRKAFGWRVTTAWLKGAPEVAAIRQRARRFPCALLLQAEHLSLGEPFENSLVRRSLKGDGWALELSVPRGAPLAESRLELDVAGVVVATRQPKLRGVQVEAWLRADGMRRNASGSDVVEGDALLEQALEALDEASVELIGARGARLCEDPAWREHFIARLARKDGRSAPGADALARLPLLPGPAGELLSLVEVEAAARAAKRLHVAFARHDEGTYPAGTVLLPEGHTFERLLPDLKRFDVADLVEKRKAIAARRAAQANLPPTPAALPDAPWLARGPIEGDGVSGELGFLARGNGAQLRLLYQGRLLERLELTEFAPLSFVAVVDWARELGDAYFEEGSAARCAELVRKQVERAVSRTLADALPAPALHPHVLGLLHNHLVAQGRPLSQLPAPVRGADVFPCVGAPPVSLATLLSRGGPWRYVEREPAQGLLDGSRLLVLSSTMKELLAKAGPRRLEDCAARLRVEAGVRQRLGASKRQAVLEDVLVKVPFSGDGFHGEVGVPRRPESRLALTVLKGGLELERTELAPRYHHAVAIVESERFEPNEQWSAAVRDALFSAVVSALFQAQRELVVPLLGTNRVSWADETHLLLATMLKRELARFDEAKCDAVQRAFLSARVFGGAREDCSVLELREVARRNAGLAVVPLGRPFRVPATFDGVFEPAAVGEALGEALDCRVSLGEHALDVALAREALERAPKVPLTLRAKVALHARHDALDHALVAGLRAGDEGLVHLTVTVGGHRYVELEVPAALPLRMVLELPKLEVASPPALSREQREVVEGLVREGVHAVLGAAAEAGAGDADADRAVLLALARSKDLAGDGAVATRLRARPVFACTDGERRGVAHFAGEPPAYAVAHDTGVLPGRRPIVIARDPLVREVMSRWPGAPCVDDELETQRLALRARQSIAAQEQIRSRREGPLRQQLSERGLEGELVLVTEGGDLELFHERKPLCVVKDVLPPFVTAALDAAALTPTHDFKGVLRDDAFAAVVAQVEASVERLAGRLADQPVDEGSLTLRAALALWTAGRTKEAWQPGWAASPRKKKKRKQGGKAAAEPARPASLTLHPLLEQPLLRANDGSAFPVATLIAARLAEGRAEQTQVGGRFLVAERRCWWPRHDVERRAADDAGFSFLDVTEAVKRDEAIRDRPRQHTVDFYADSPWREPVQAPSVEGVAVLRHTLEPKLVIELLKDGVPLELYAVDHPVGGLARVDSKSVTPNTEWTAARRDAPFKALVGATEAALERALARRLSRFDARDADWALAALRWRGGQPGPLGEALTSLPLFSDLAGREVTVGAALQLAAARGRVPLAQAAAGEHPGVLRDTGRTRGLLEALKLGFEDVTADLQRAKDLQQALTARRLAGFGTGPALLRRKVATPSLTGELALSLDPAAAEPVTLAREGIAVGPLELAWPGVIGVLDVKDLTVNADWTEAKLSRAQRELVTDEVTALFEGLAAEALRFDDARRELALLWALRFLEGAGVTHAAQVPGLGGAQAALAAAPLFLTADGQRVSLRAVADEVSSRKRIAVLPRGADADARGTSCVLTSSSPSAPWLEALERVLGSASRVWRVKDVADWAAEQREADPPSGTPELEGLLALRRFVRLLRAGALGNLTTEDLDDVRLSRAGGRTALRYDRKRKLVLLDPEDRDVARALAEAPQRPERLWVLLAAVFSLVNRELDHVTDAHEAQLLVTLAGHLAANPQLLR